ncbi:MAG: alkaline phosphatase family protein, partial [Chitinophagaceae bacterium]
MSPKNMMVTTIGDELRLATNFRSKVIGIALKDRGAILPAGHSANAAYWYDNTNGNWITSTHYMNQLPDWVNQMNNRKLVDSFYQLNWQTLYPINTYTQSTADVKTYEATPFGADQKGFPYQLQPFKGKNYGAIATTPYGNSITFEMAKAAIINEQLGKRGETDMLCVSFSSPDYIGHSFGPNSVETEDNYLRLDLEMAAFFDFLDKEIGVNNYTVFLTADHGVAHVPQFLKENNLPGGVFDDKAVQQQLNTLLKERFGKDKLVTSMYNYQVHFNHAILDTADIEMEEVVKIVKKHLYKNEAVASVFELGEVQEYPMN